MDQENLSPTTKLLREDQQQRVRNDFLFEWFQKFHSSSSVLKTLYKFTRNDCLFNLRYLAMVMFFAVPNEFDPVISAG